MPFDPFFSSANNKHYIERKGVNKEFNRILSLPFEQRVEAIKIIKDKKLKREATLVELVVLRKLAHAFRRASKVKFHIKDDKEHSINKKRMDMDKAKGRTVTFLSGYNTCHK